MKRRAFLRTLGAGAAGAAWAPRLLSGQDARRFVILHTNDTHSRIDPFPDDGGPLGGLGGIARRATWVDLVRRDEPHVLLLDSGDVVQGTPYFNLFRGEVEWKAMSSVGYDVGTIGNHEFDNGVEGMAEMLEHADFDIVCANYRIEHALLSSRIRPYVIREMGSVRVGVFGLGIRLRGLVEDRHRQGFEYVDAVGIATDMVAELRDARCDVIVCLSHLGHEYRDERASDVRLATEVPGLDIVLGGHTHTFLDRPFVHTHDDGQRSMVHQVGWGGVRLGRIDVTVDIDGNVRSVSSGYRVGARLG